jgi:hypothetical protein
VHTRYRRKRNLGYRTVLGLTDQASASLNIEFVNRMGRRFRAESIHSVRIILGGHQEFHQVREALQFMLDVLNGKITEQPPEQPDEEPMWLGPDWLTGEGDD